MTKQVEVVAIARGFDSAAARTRNEGDKFMVDEAAAEKGASWFKRIGEASKPLPKAPTFPSGQAGDGSKAQAEQLRKQGVETLLGAKDDGANLV